MEEKVKDELWLWVERTVGKLCGQFIMPTNADLEKVREHLENRVLKITVPKLIEQETKHELKLISILSDEKQCEIYREDVKPNKKEL